VPGTRILFWVRKGQWNCFSTFCVCGPEFATEQVQPTLYSYNQLKIATRDFHPDHKLGESGFGVVYKVMLTVPSISAYTVMKIFMKYPKVKDQ
jgi:hypothetical protein